MFLPVVNGLDVEGGEGAFNILDVEFVGSGDFGGVGRGKDDLIIELVVELFFADVAGMLFLDGEVQAGEAVFVELVDAANSLLVVQGLAPLSPHWTIIE